MSTPKLEYSDLSTIFPKFKGNSLFDHVACPLYKGGCQGTGVWILMSCITFVFRSFGNKDPYPRYIPVVLTSLFEEILLKMIDLVYSGTEKILKTTACKPLSDKLKTLSNKIDDLTYQKINNTNKYNLANIAETELIQTKSSHNELFRRIFYQQLFKSISEFIVTQVSCKIIRNIGYTEKLIIVSVVNNSTFTLLAIEMLGCLGAVISEFNLKTAAKIET